MKTNSLQKKKLKCILFTYKNEIIKIKLNKNEIIHDKNDLQLLPIIRNSRKPPKRYPKKVESEENIIETPSSLKKEIQPIFDNLSSFNELLNFDNECIELDEINEVFMNFY